MHLDLKRDIRNALDIFVPDDVPESASNAVLAAVLPHFELAYQRGRQAGGSKAGYRLVEENQRLRHGMRRMREVVEDYGDRAAIQAIHAFLDDFIDDKEQS
ncbi:hypothetical protein EAO77_38050 [Streptomyces sp. t39]|nr:hypothetical protein EAO77_38050 [Streptomyces sp. t39]